MNPKRYAFSPETLIKAYSLGVFPMADGAESQTIKFYDPDKRALIPLAVGAEPQHGIGHFHLPKRLQRTVRQARFEITINKDFPAVIAECAAPRAKRTDTWINTDIKRLYIALHKLGFAHSIEVWRDGELVGGLYGVALRAAMFSRVTDASKVALVHLVARLRDGGFQILDAQFTNDHLKQFGIAEVPRDIFQQHLSLALAQTANIQPDETDHVMLEKMFAAISAAQPK
jgi:leucyl/phenylalanyl-tRNA--protein transferase